LEDYWEARRAALHHAPSVANAGRPRVEVAGHPDSRRFEIPDRLVGCCFDYKRLYRNLGYIAVMTSGEDLDQKLMNPQITRSAVLRKAPPMTEKQKC
jgi:hypothetical protein